MAAKAKVKDPVTSSEVRDELDRLAAKRDAATAEYLRLEGLRDSVLLDGSDDDVRRHDEAMSSAKIQAERAGLKYERTVPLLDAAEAGEEQARRRVKYEAAEAKRDDARKAIEQYEAAAETLAKIANRISLAAYVVEEANKDLPDGYAPLDPAEPFNGKPFAPVKYEDAKIQVAFDKRTGEVRNGYNPDDPNIGYRWEKTGRKTIVQTHSSATPHRSFLYGLFIPSRTAGKVHF